MLCSPLVTVRTVAFVVKPESEEARGLAAELSEMLAARGIRVVREGEDSFADADLCVVAGGDGTLIHAAALVGGAEVPIFGINAGGQLGFLTEIPRDRARELLTAALAGRCPVERRGKLRARVLRRGETLVDAEVLNDAVIHRGALPQMVELVTRVDGAPVGSLRADGVIVATPTGSTAYSLAANGPVVYPTLDAVLVNPICPHMLTQRPLVVPSRCCTEIEVAAAGGEVQLSLDGRTAASLRAGDRVRIERAAHHCMLIKNPDLDFFSILREKLRWSER